MRGPTAHDGHHALAAEHEHEADSAIQIGTIVQILRRRWKLILLTTAAALAVFAARYAVTPKMYEAYAEIRIEKRSLAGLGGSSASNPWLENFYSLDFYPTQYRLLQSRGLAERVVKALDLANDPKYNPGRFAPAAEGAEPTPEDDARVMGHLANRVRSGLRVLPIEKTQMARIYYRSTDRDEVAPLANAFAEEFIQWGIDSRIETADEASKLLNEQIDDLKGRIDVKEEQLRDLSRRANLVGIDQGSSQASENLGQLRASMNQARTERIEAQARLDALRNRPRSDLAENLAESEVGALRGELSRLERDYEAQLQTYKPEFPAMRELRSQIDRARQELQKLINDTADRAIQAARVDYQTALRKEQALVSEVDAGAERKLQEGSATVTARTLRDEIDNDRQELARLRQRQNETSFTTRLQRFPQSNVSVVEAALAPGGPFRPSLRRELSLGLILGLLGGVGLVLLFEFLDRTLKDHQEAERLLGLPTLAVIPDIADSGRKYRAGYGYGYGTRRKSKGGKSGSTVPSEEASIELLPHTHPRLVASEAYRSLRTALLLASAEELKVVALTSAESGEGKTTTATNLAVVMAQLGQRVLLVDADLRKPRVHKVFKVSNRYGLVNLLTGSGEPPSQVYQNTPVPNLYLLPSGPIPPNPAELLASERMAEFVDQVREHFDFVVVDTTPTLAVTDATLVGSMADGVLICLRAGKLLREEARACRDRLLRADVRILGTVLNRYRATPGSYGRRYRQYEAYAEAQTEAKADSAA